MRTDYAGHEALYQKLKDQPDRPGWDAAEALARDLQILDGVLAWPAFPRSGKLLEMGCGAGNASLHLAARGWTVSGVDIAPTAIAWAAENAAAQRREADFRVADVLTLDGLADCTFDVVLDGHCLHCIIGADRRLFFAAAHRVLRPGGSICIRTMCNEVPHSVAAGSGYDPRSRCLVREGVATRYVGRAGDIVAEITNAGFDVARSEVLAANGPADLDELLLLARRPA